MKRGSTTPRGMSQSSSRFLPKFFRLFFVISFLLGLAACKMPSVGYNDGYAPEQPIPFDHALHAGKNKIECLYCHAGAEVSKQATVPSLNICMNCHLQVNGPEKKEGEVNYIEKLREHHANNESIQWKRVHMLPDFVKFNHKRHVQRGVACQKCHGPVEEMTKVYQHSDLSMGWCVQCHREPENDAPLNCSTCHY